MAWLHRAVPTFPSGNRNVVEDALEDVVGAEPFGIRLEADEDAMAHDVTGQALDVVRSHEIAAGEQGVAARGAQERDRGARAGARARAGVPAAARMRPDRGSRGPGRRCTPSRQVAILIEAASARNATTSVGPKSGGSSLVLVSESGRRVSETLGRSSILSSALRSG